MERQVALMHSWWERELAAVEQEGNLHYEAKWMCALVLQDHISEDRSQRNPHADAKGDRYKNIHHGSTVFESRNLEAPM